MCWAVVYYGGICCERVCVFLCVLCLCVASKTSRTKDTLPKCEPTRMYTVHGRSGKERKGDRESESEKGGKRGWYGERENHARTHAQKELIVAVTWVGDWQGVCNYWAPEACE